MYFQKYLFLITNFSKKNGKGGFGKVYIIEHSEESKRLAAKESNEIMNDESPAATFFKEINAYSKIYNPTILTLFWLQFYQFIMAIHFQ